MGYIVKECLCHNCNSVVLWVIWGEGLLLITFLQHSVQVFENLHAWLYMHTQDCVLIF
jgi:hypothetical protein